MVIRYKPTLNRKNTTKSFWDYWAIKLAFLILAAFLWFHVVTEKQYEWILRVPLQVHTDGQQVVLATRLPKYARVRFSGSGKALIRLWLSDRQLVIPVAEKTRQRNVEKTLRTDQVAIPQALSSINAVEIIEPKSIRFDLDRPISKKVGVVPQVLLTFASGFDQIGPIRLAPDHVELLGPAQFVAPVESVLLDSLNIQNAKQDIIAEIPVLIPEGVGLSCDPASVKVLIDVQALGERIFAHLPVAVDRVPNYTKVRSEPPTVTLKVVGGSDLLETIESTDFKVTIAVSYTHLTLPTN